MLAENLTDLICHHQPDGRYEWLSPSVEAILGYAPEALVGEDPYELFHPDDCERIRTESHEQILNGQEANTLIQYRIRHSEGHYVWLESLTETLRDASGEIVRLQVTSRDVTERQAIEEELQRQAHHDPLTGLANRTLLTLRLDALVASGETDFAVLYLDLDRFKAVNDTLGHSVGDELLVQLASRLRREARQCDTVARIGGDEFALLLTEIESEDDAVAAAARVSHAVHAPFDLGGTLREVTLSVGIVLGREDQQASGDVLREADLAAYDAKKNGRAGWRLFTPALREASDRRRRLEADLERAAERNELRVAYQPIVRLSDGALSGMEALVRWQHPELGLLYPDVFISIAEEIGRIGEVDRWVMQEGLRQFERWEAEMGREIDLTLSVNCSARDLHEPRFAERVRGIVGAEPRRAERLTLEITESLLVDDPQRAAAVLHELRRDGLRFSMDDFGTGYSSLSVIHALPVDTVKVDRAFVQRMHEDASALAMVNNVVGFAHTLGKDIVAEGIETPEHLVALREMGCEYGQGYLFGKPLAPDVMSTLVRADVPSWAPLWESVRA
ncbi:hypothetical protein BSZ36_00140 [Rubricoccus marinus]|uniref:GGDEF domain-containing protein n=1 Tax=Rubricoccus marinus TaxID=716817 RepID=A0A259U3U5_9BACT|nr:hypothetical protein BSZ36_00140 [Rubricoccus marinus]